MFNLNSEWFIEETKVEEKNKTYPYYDTEFSGELNVAIKQSIKLD